MAKPSCFFLGIWVRIVFSNEPVDYKRLSHLVYVGNYHFLGLLQLRESTQDLKSRLECVGNASSEFLTVRFYMR